MVNTDTKSGKAAFAAALAAVVIGGAVLTGWMFDLDDLKRVFPGFTVMNPATAVAFILAGISLALFLRISTGGDQKARALIATARLCAGVVVLIGLARLTAILCGWDLGVDQWFFASKLANGLEPPNRLAPNTALNFLLLGSALLLVDVKRRSVRYGVELAAMVVGTVSLLAVLGYVYSIQPLYRLGPFTPMAVHTAITFSVLSVGVLLSHTDSGLLAVFVGGNTGGKLARRLLPAAMLVPALIGWLARLGEQAGYTVAVCDAAETMGNSSVFAFIICWTARELFKTDIRRGKAEEETRFNEQRYRSLVEATTAIVWDTPASGEFVVEQPGWTALTGQSFEELRGWGWLKAIHPDDQEETGRAWTAAVKSRSIYKVEHRLRTRDGTYRDMMVRAVPVLAEGGSIHQWIGIHTDITERKQAEAWRRQLASIVESSEDAIVGKDLNSNVTSWNAAAGRMFGYPAQEILGTSIRRLIPPDRQAEEDRIMASIRRGEPVLHFETVRQTSSGTMIDVSVTVSPIKDASGKVVGASKIARDITAQKRAEAELRWKTAFLEAQVKSSLDGVLVADGQGKKLLQNQRLTDLLKIPQHITDDPDDEMQRLWIMGMTRDPAASIVKVAHLKSHPDETSRDEVELTDGTVLDCYSAPVVGDDGTYFGRIWTFRDITERTRSEALLLESQQRLALATESAHLGIWDWNLVENEMVWDAQTLALYGLRPDDSGGALNAWQNGLHREDRERAEAEIAAALDGTHDFRSEYRVVWPRGEVREIEAYGLVQRAADGTPTRMIGVNWDVTARKRTEARYRRLVESNVQAILFWNATGGITGANDAFLSLTGYSREDLEAGQINWMDLTPPEYADLDRRALEEIAAHGTSGLYEKEFNRKDGSRVPVLLGSTAFVDDPEEGVCFVLDLTDRKRLETQLVQSQKLETVGKLAGGIAHEFNSILTAIIGQSELLLADLPSGSPLATNATEITKAAGRAAALTRQLLAYGRKQLLQPEALDLNRVITRMEGVLRHLMGGEIDTRIVATPGLHAVKADASQLEQVIMQIALNARDAMPNGGKFTLETADVSFDQESVANYPELKPGDYVMLAITDNGHGMSPEVKARLFEPFFSTKGVGEGTGLGLSTCYGIIKQSGGHISVYSELARGATFKIYLPQVEKPKTVSVRSPAPVNLPRGTETILLVEDDPALREMAAGLLRRLGYTVLAAANGIEALSLKEQRGTGHIDLLFTDVVMPHMSGKELADRVQALYPHTRILFTSAYTENAIAHQDVLSKGVALLQKPFMPSALAHKVREVLDQPADTAARD